ncbi:hypothetical protein Tco_0411482 [Tanacetum coccineum]
MSPKEVLMKTGLTPVNTVRLVNTAHPKITVHSAKSKTHFSKQAQLTTIRPFYKQTTLTRRSVHEAKRHYYTGRHYAVNTARSYSGQVNAVRGKPQHDDKGFVDSGCSRHMTGSWVTEMKGLPLLLLAKKQSRTVVTSNKNPNLGKLKECNSLGSVLVSVTSCRKGEDSDHPTDSTLIPIIDQPSLSSQPKKKQPSKKAPRQEAEIPQVEAEHKESVPTPSNDPQPSGEDSMKLTDLMVLCTKLQTQVLDLQKAKDAQAKEIDALKKRI